MSSLLQSSSQKPTLSADEFHSILEKCELRAMCKMSQLDKNTSKIVQNCPSSICVDATQFSLIIRKENVVVIHNKNSHWFTTYSLEEWSNHVATFPITLYETISLTKSVTPELFIDKLIRMKLKARIVDVNHHMLLYMVGCEWSNNILCTFVAGEAEFKDFIVYKDNFYKITTLTRSNHEDVVLVDEEPSEGRTKKLALYKKPWRPEDISSPAA